MKQRRLVALVAAMLSLGALRVFVPPERSASNVRDDTVVVAVPRSPNSVVSGAATISTPPQMVATLDRPGVPERDVEDLADIRDAFATPKPKPAPTPPPSPKPPPAPPSFVGPPAPPPPAPPPPPPPPPFQVVGGFWDETGAAVALVGMRGLVVGRTGDLLFNEYRILRISDSQVLLRQVTANQDVLIAIPPAAGAALRSH